MDVSNIRTIEERLEHATEYARQKMHWHWWVIRLSLPINIALIIFVFDPMLKGEHWALAAGGVILAVIALGMTAMSRRMKQFTTPTPEQKAAIDDALNARNYPLAIQLVDDMLTYIHSAETLKLAAIVYARGGKFHEPKSLAATPQPSSSVTRPHAIPKKKRPTTNAPSVIPKRSWGSP